MRHMPAIELHMDLSLQLECERATVLIVLLAQSLLHRLADKQTIQTIDLRFG